MDKEKILEGMSYVDPALVEAADAAPCRRRSVWRRPALIAACLCLALAGTAVAVAIGLNWTVGGPFTLSNGENFAGSVEVWSTEALPVESLSQEARDLAAAGADSAAFTGLPAESDKVEFVDPETGETTTCYTIQYGMDSWDELESFLGVDVLPENPVLRNAISGTISMDEADEQIWNYVLELFTNDSGELLSVNTMGGFNTTYDPAADVSTVMLSVYTNARTDRNPYPNGGGISTVYETAADLAQSTQEEYVTPSGLKCLLTSTGIGGWEAYFCHGAFVVNLKAAAFGDASDEVVRAELIRVLDAFE